jgi:hypothetical protein
MKLYGALPVSLGQMENIHDLYLSSNEFSGTLPTEWSRIGVLSSDMDL